MTVNHLTQNPETKPAVPVMQQLGVLTLILLLIFGTSLIPEPSHVNEPTTASELLTLPEQESSLQPVNAEDPFTHVSITGEAAFVWDVQKQRVLYQKNPDKQLPLASITKLMTAVVAHELIDGSDVVAINLESLAQDGDNGFVDGEAFQASDLLDLTLLGSSNDGAFALAVAAGALLDEEAPANTFVAAMNLKAEELGLAQTYFRNPTGLDISTTEGGAYGSARDVNFLMEYVLTKYPVILEQTQNTSITIDNQSGAIHSVQNTNQQVDQITGLIGSKTGFTDLAGGNLTIAFDAALNRPVIIVVLNSTFYDRFSDVEQLSTTARAVIAQ